MNRTFTKEKKIILDENWHLTPDGDNGIVLTFHEVREKVGKDGVKEDYLFEEKYYYTRVVQALKEYVEATQNDNETLQKILEKQEYITNLLEKIDKEFKQFK